MVQNKNLEGNVVEIYSLELFQEVTGNYILPAPKHQTNKGVVIES